MRYTISMSDITFDTLQYAKRLKKAGVTDQQAEVHAEALKELIDGKLATKQDIKNLEYKLTLRLGSMIVAGVGFISALMVILKVF